MSPDDAQRLLNIIGEDIYLKKVSLSIDNKNLTIPESTTHIEAIGFKAEIAKDGLKQMLETTGETADTKEDADWTQLFLSEEEFQCYVFQLFDFLIACAQNLLPDSGQIPAFEDRAKATARDNAEEFEDEIEKVKLHNPMAPLKCSYQKNEEQYEHIRICSGLYKRAKRGQADYRHAGVRRGRQAHCSGQAER